MNLKPRNVLLWSNKLNQFQNDMNYQRIENNIRNYMSLYAIDIMRYSQTIYHDHILLTNIKRWNKISISYNFVTSPLHNKIINLFNIYSKIKEVNLNDSILNIFKDVETLIYLNEFDELVHYALENNKHSILDYLKEIPNYNLLAEIKHNYNLLTFDNKISMNKLCLLYNDLYKKE
jgi:hypothetical protein